MSGGGLDALMSKMPKAKGSEPAEGDMEEGPDAMRDLGEALADKDWTSAWTAFQTACKLCEGYENEGGDEEG